MLRSGVGKVVKKGGKGLLYGGIGSVVAGKAAWEVYQGTTNFALGLNGGESNLSDGMFRYALTPGNYNRVKLAEEIAEDREKSLQYDQEPEDPHLFKPTQYMHGGRVQNETSGRGYGRSGNPGMVATRSMRSTSGGYGSRQNFTPSGDIVLGMHRMR